MCYYLFPFLNNIYCHDYDNICILQNLVFSVYYRVFLFNICMSIHPMTKVTGVLDISNKIVKCEPYLDNNVWKLKVSFYADGNVHNMIFTPTS